jgi:ATP-dependent RNA helicase DeaD
MLTFKETGLSEELIKAVVDLGFESPTPIQEQTIPALLSSGTDLIGLAQTGTGKTAAFGLPLIQLTDTGEKKIQSLILCPTRELCMQITNDMENFSKYARGFRSVAVYGGASIQNQIKLIKEGCHMVVGTPGRVLDLIERKVLKFGGIKWLVLDEADRMADAIVAGRLRGKLEP